MHSGAARPTQEWAGWRKVGRRPPTLGGGPGFIAVTLS